MYSRALIAARGEHCFRCGTDQSLIIHHVDGNRSNNNLSNLDVLCRECHGNVHKNKPRIVHIESPKLKREHLLFELYKRFEHGLNLMTGFDSGFSAEDIIQFIEDMGITIQKEESE